MISLWDVLKASKGLPVSDLYAAMWGRKMAVKYTVTELEGTLPMSIVSAGEPLMDYRIYGNTEQTGTPTPENPIMPSGCGERTENLWNGDEVTQIQVTSDASIVRYGMAFSGSAFSLCLISDDSLMYYKIKTGNTYGTAIQLPVGVAITITLTDNQTLLIYGEILINVQQATIQVNGGASYIPYGYKLPISSAGQNVDIYLGESQTTRRIKKLVLTGTETLGYNAINHVAYISTPDSFLGEGVSVISTHYAAVSNKKAYTQLSDNQCCLRADINHLWIRDDDCSNVTNFKAFLAAQYAAGTPVTVWYVLAEPETGIVNEPLMKIGDYTDMVSMEQAGVSIPTNNGSTVIDYDGTLKPSEMYIKYLGGKK